MQDLDVGPIDHLAVESPAVGVRGARVTEEELAMQRARLAGVR